MYFIRCIYFAGVIGAMQGIVLSFTYSAYFIDGQIKTNKKHIQQYTVVGCGTGDKYRAILGIEKMQWRLNSFGIVTGNLIIKDY
jgi:hypothetical protein